MKRALTAIVSVAVMTLFMTGCSTVRIIDSDVTAISQWRAAPPVPGTPYRFERLPLQQTIGAQQDRLEALASAALAKVGMELKPDAAHYSVQVVAKTLVMEQWPYGGWHDGFGFPGPGPFPGRWRHGASMGLWYPMGFPERYYQRELSLLMRELASGQIVFETRALHDGVWSDSLAVLPAMLDSALLGFPQPPTGLRRVSVQIPR